MIGYVQIYTGDGKGKTTAAIGLAVRAAGAGLKVFFAQFIKGGAYSEIIALQRFADRITVRQYGQGRFINGRPAEEDRMAAQAGLGEIKTLMARGDHQLIILDEANVALSCGLLALDDMVALLDAKPCSVELVLTGRNAPAELIERADLVTEMLAVKHYYQRGVMARTGIEK